MIIPSSIRNFRKILSPELYQKLRIEPCLVLFSKRSNEGGIFTGDDSISARYWTVWRSIDDKLDEQV